MEVVDAVLDRMERLEPILHAFCWPASFVPPRRPRGSRRSATAWHHQATEGQAARVERWPGSTLRPTAYTVREEEVTKLVVRACPPDRFIEASMSLSTPSRTTSGTRLRGGWHEEPQGTAEASVLREPAASGHARRLAYAHHARGGLGTRCEGEGLSGAGLSYLLSVCCWSSVPRRWSSTSFWPSGETDGLCPSGAGTPDGLSRWPGVGVSGPGAF